MSELDTLKDILNAFSDAEVSEEVFTQKLNSYFGIKSPKPRKARKPKVVVAKNWDDYKPFTKTRRGLGSY